MHWCKLHACMLEHHALVQTGQAGEQRLWLCVSGMFIGTAIAYLDFQMRDHVL